MLPPFGPARLRLNTISDPDQLGVGDPGPGAITRIGDPDNFAE
jgi:hypothetical protein